jgi:hypothetical protein
MPFAPVASWNRAKTFEPWRETERAQRVNRALQSHKHERYTTAGQASASLVCNARIVAQRVRRIARMGKLDLLLALASTRARFLRQ